MNVKFFYAALFFPLAVLSVEIPQVNYDELRSQNEKAINQVSPKSLTFEPYGVKAPPTGPVSSDIDVGALIDKFNDAKNNEGEEKRKPGLYALVSLSVPQPVLKEIAKEVKRAGGVMVLKGFTKETSAKQTALALAEINKGIDAQWSIDPDLFKALKVEKAPAIAIVISKEGVTICEQAQQEKDACGDSYDSAIAYGDISVAHAMRRIINGSKQKSIRHEANKILGKLETL